MPDPITISFVANTELKTLLDQWAKEEERSVSYVLRDILKREQQRRAQVQYTRQKSTKSN